MSLHCAQVSRATASRLSTVCCTAGLQLGVVQAAVVGAHGRPGGLHRQLRLHDGLAAAAHGLRLTRRLHVRRPPCKHVLYPCRGVAPNSTASPHAWTSMLRKHIVATLPPGASDRAQGICTPQLCLTSLDCLRTRVSVCGPLNMFCPVLLTPGRGTCTTLTARMAAKTRCGGA